MGTENFNNTVDSLPSAVLKIPGCYSHGKRMEVLLRAGKSPGMCSIPVEEVSGHDMESRAGDKLDAPTANMFLILDSRRVSCSR